MNQVRDSLLFVCCDFPAMVEISFPAMEDGSVVADAIGIAFEAILQTRWRGSPESLYDEWQGRATGLDPRVQVATPWSIVDDSMGPVNIFEAR
jgi:hypothetical protein